MSLGLTGILSWNPRITIDSGNVTLDGQRAVNMGTDKTASLMPVWVGMISSMEVLHRMEQRLDIITTYFRKTMHLLKLLFQ
jgi:hypothetical protein